MSALLTLQFLAWAADRPRRYAEVRFAWQSTCPLNSAWEDALAEGLVTVAARDGGTMVELTAAGQAALLGYQRPLAAE